MCLSACSGPSGYVPLSNGDTWQEEVLLHDGQKIVAERTTVRGGRHEAGQKGDYVAQSIRFTLPGGSQRIEWEDTRINSIGNSSFLPMALDVVKGTPYIVANTMGCLAYNQWGRPNPPYVIFKFEANDMDAHPHGSFASGSQNAQSCAVNARPYGRQRAKTLCDCPEDRSNRWGIPTGRIPLRPAGASELRPVMHPYGDERERALAG